MILNHATTNFTSGELTPRMLGRTDVVRYANGLKRAENVLILVHGGAMGRPGTLFVASAKEPDKDVILIPYVFNTDQAYQIEAGDGYMRFYTSDGAQIETLPGVPYEIASPYTEDQIRDIDFIQRADTMLLFHGDVPTQRLQRYGNTDWRLGPVPWETEPFDELGARPAASLTLSAATVGTGRTFTAGAAAFEATDVGRMIEAGGGLAEITGYTSTTQVTATIETAFPGNSVASGEWLLAGSPQATCTPSATGPVGASITLTLVAAGWRAGDEGKFVIVNAGLVQITSVSSATVATGTVRVELAATVGAPPSSWALCRSMWGQEFGYPRTGSFHQQRAWAGGSPGFPQTIWMSRVGEPYNFEIGTSAAAGYTFDIDSDQANPIRHLASVRSLVCLTSSNEHTITGAGGDAIAPDRIDTQNQSAFGCGKPAPVRIGNELVMVCPATDDETGSERDEIRAMSADRFDNRNYAAPDLTALAEHITESGIVDMDAAKTMLYAIRGDGKMVAMRVDRDNDVVAASRFITAGEFRSVSVIPKGGSREVWAVVKRVINGDEQRYIERFVPGVYSDCAVRGEVGGNGATNWAGGDHLRGETVAVRADGVVVNDAVVSAGGEIELDSAANSVEFGLPFVPLIELLPPEVQTQRGTIQGEMMRTVNAKVRVKDTLGLWVNGRRVTFESFETTEFDVPTDPKSGFIDTELLGHYRGDPPLIIEQRQANPFHVLSVVRKMEVNPT